jgi:hypothetical protein
MDSRFYQNITDSSNKNELEKCQNIIPLEIVKD